MKKQSKMTVVSVKISDLSSHPANAGLYEMYDIEGLMVNIQEKGLLEPLIVDKANQVISGNRRLEAITRLGWTEVDVIYSDSKEDDIQYLIFCHNKSRVKSFRERLNELAMLEAKFRKGSGKGKKGEKHNWRTLAAIEMGMSESQLNMFIKVRENESLVKYIEQGILTLNNAYNSLIGREKLDEAIRLKEAEIEDFITDDVKIYTRSSADLSMIETGTVQCTFTSPPYPNQLRNYGVDGLGTESLVESYIENMVSHFRETVRVTNDKGSIFINIADCYIDGTLQMVPQRLAWGLVKEYGLKIRNTIIWRKKNCKPSRGETTLTPTYEFIIHLVKSDDYYFDPAKVPTLSENSRPTIPMHRCNSNDWWATPIISKGIKTMSDYWDEDVVTTAVANHPYSKHLNLNHPAPFPENICILPILQTTKPGDIVLDIFSGSGTVVRVASFLGRRAIGVDLQPNFNHAVIEDFKRLAA